MAKQEMNDMLDMYIYESSKMLESLEMFLLDAEEKGYEPKIVEEIFRIMHSMKGAAATMGFENSAKLCHAMEDIFSEIRETGKLNIDSSWITSMLLICKDFLSEELQKARNDEYEEANSDDLVEEIRKNLNYMKKNKSTPLEDSEYGNINFEIKNMGEFKVDEGIKTYYAKIFFEKDSGMLNVRALILVQRIAETMLIREHIPYELSNPETEEVIVKKGFQIMFDTNLEKEALKEFIADNAVCMESIELSVLNEKENSKAKEINVVEKNIMKKDENLKQENKNIKGYLSIGVEKLDKLMDITSEIIITQALLIQNPEIKKMKIKNFEKVARQFKKITTELQDIVMSLRMLPLMQVFQKMKRIVRDVSEKMGKKVELTIIGETTEVDKNIIEMISDPLMHIIRNSVDHGIEMPEERIKKGKPETGKIVLEARHVGGDVWIEIEDDGGGLNKNKIYKKALETGLTQKSIEELDDKEIYNFIFKPGFSTKEEASEYSGRGVGMDVVYKNIEKLNGTVSIEKTSNKGTVIILKIPLTLAIINGMTVKVGTTKYTVPVDSIVEIIALKEKNIFLDTEGKEFVNIRDKYYTVVKLYERFGIKSEKTNLTEGMALIVQASEEDLCIFADSLIGEQQVVVKPLPNYLKKVKGIAGCSILGDGTISLIMDVDKILEK